MFLIRWLLLTLVVAAAASSSAWSINWADTAYPLDRCLNGTLANALGGLTLSSDLAGRSLQLRFDLDQPFQSCYLCAQYGQCGAVAPSAIYLTLDTPSNVQLLLLDDSDRPSVLRYYDVASDRGQGEFLANLTLPVSDLGLSPQCGARLRLLVAALLTIDEPANKDLYALAYPAAATNSPAPINCTSHALYDAMSIDCEATPLLFPIVYEMQPCVTVYDDSGGEAPVSPPPPASLTRWSPLYWYMALAMDNTTPLPPPLCGESPDVLLFRTDLYQQQCYGIGANQSCEWWDQLLVRYLTLWLNAWRANASDNTRVHVALESARALLERACTRRHSCLVPMAAKAMASLSACDDYYTAEEGELDNETVCRQLRDYFEAHYSATERDFLALFGAWYLSVFHALIYPDRAFATKTTLFILGVFFTTLFLFLAVGVAGFKMRIKVKKSMLAK